MKAQVLLPKVFNFPFTYNSNNISIKTGDHVEVPFGKNKEIGVVWKNKNIGRLHIYKMLFVMFEYNCNADGRGDSTILQDQFTNKVSCE